MDLEKLVKEGFFKKGEKMLVGVSGGIDSMALISYLNKLKERYEFHIIVAHLNHGLRKEADKDDLFVKNYCEKNYLDFISKKIKLTSKNMEEKARDERYKFFEEIKQKENVDSIVTAHTANDQAETIILNLVRGSGLKGLKGMEFYNKIKRPFLKITRREIEKYAKKNKIEWREDKTNKDVKYSRNRVRHSVIPELEKINPKTTENILRTSENIAEYSHFLDELIQKEVKKLTVRRENGISFDLKKLKNKNLFLQKEIIYQALYSLNPKSVEKVHIENIIDLLSTKGTKEISLPLGLKAEKIYDNLLISLRGKKSVKKEEKKALKNRLYWGESYLLEILSADSKAPKNKNTAILEKVKGSLWVRPKKDGDFLFLDKGTKKKKLSDIFIDAKVPKKKRENYPIVVSEGDEVVWVPGIRVSGKFAAKTEKNIIKLRFKELNEK